MLMRALFAMLPLIVLASCQPSSSPTALPKNEEPALDIPVPEFSFTERSGKTITNTFAIDRFYRVPYAQTWNASIQQELPYRLVLQVSYLATKGTRLDTLRLPNRAAPGSPLTSEERRQIGDATGFTFETSDANSIYHSGRVSLPAASMPRGSRWLRPATTSPIFCWGFRIQIRSASVTRPRISAVRIIHSSGRTIGV